MTFGFRNSSNMARCQAWSAQETCSSLRKSTPGKATGTNLERFRSWACRRYPLSSGHRRIGSFRESRTWTWQEKVTFRCSKELKSIVFKILRNLQTWQWHHERKEQRPYSFSFSDEPQNSWDSEKSHDSENRWLDQMRNQIRESRSNDGDDHDNQIKNVPRDCEVMLPQTDQFQNDFRTENTDKDVVELL